MRHRKFFLNFAFNFLYAAAAVAALIFQVPTHAARMFDLVSPIAVSPNSAQPQKKLGASSPNVSSIASKLAKVSDATEPAERTSISNEPLPIRQRRVALELGALAQVAEAMKRAPTQLQLVRIALFDDTVLIVEIQRTEPTYSGGVAYSGRVQGMPGSSVVLVDNGGVVAIEISAAAQHFSIVGLASASASLGSVDALHYTVREHSADPRENAPDEPIIITGKQIRAAELKILKDANTVKANQSTATSASASNPNSNPAPLKAGPTVPIKNLLDDGSIIDVMVVYTPLVAAPYIAAGGIAGLNTAIDNMVAYTNNAYANSGVKQRIRLVYRGFTDYVESSPGTDLSRIANTSDGFMDDVPTLRNLYQADMVVLLSNPAGAGSCGIGYVMANESAGFAGSAYSQVNCYNSGRTFAHELGHNMGLSHDVTTSPGTSSTVTPEAGGAAVKITYSRGYWDTTNRFYTVMAYGCSGCSFSNTFSNPAITYDNRPAYAAAMPAPMGGLDANEAQALNDTRETVANFRASLATFSGPGIVSFLPAAYNVIKGVTSVTIKVGRHVGSTGAIAVNYSTVNGTALAGADFTAASGVLNWADADTTDRTIIIPMLVNAAPLATSTFTVALSGITGGAAINASASTASVKITTIASPQVISFSALSNRVLGSAPFNVSAAGGASGNPVTFMAAPAGVCTNSGANGVTIALIATGVCTVTASQLGNVSYSDAVAVPQSFTIISAAPAPQFIAFGQLANRLLSSGVFTVAAAGGSSGNPITFAATPVGVCSSGGTNGTAITLIAAGSCTITANQAGNASFAAATAVAQTFSVLPAIPLSRRGGIDLDGFGKGAIILRATNNNQLLAGRLASGAFQWNLMADPGPDYRVLGALDLAGTGKSDLALLRDNPVLLNANGQGTAVIWQNFAGSIPLILRDVKPAWDVQAVGDLDGDGRGDLVWRYRGTSANIDDQGVSYIWFSNGQDISQVRKRGGAPLTWTLLGAADLNLDGAMDMIYVSPANAMRVLMATPARTCANLSGGVIPAGFTALKLADFTGNSKGDVLIRNATTGEARLIALDATGLTLPLYTGAPDDPNASCTSSVLTVTQNVVNLTNTDPAWTFYAAGDLNGDGIFDIVWKRADGTLTVWLMNANGAAPTVIDNAGLAPAGFNNIAR